MQLVHGRDATPESLNDSIQEHLFHCALCKDTKVAADRLNCSFIFAYLSRIRKSLSCWNPLFDDVFNSGENWEFLFVSRQPCLPFPPAQGDLRHGQRVTPLDFLGQLAVTFTRLTQQRK